MPTLSDAQICARLTRHQQWRDRGLCTLSVLVGDGESLSAALRQWAYASQRRLIGVPSWDAATLTAAGCETKTPGPLALAAARHLCAALGRPESPSVFLSHLLAATSCERSVLLETASGRLSPDLARACAAALQIGDGVAASRLGPHALASLQPDATDTQHVVYSLPSGDTRTPTAASPADLPQALGWAMSFPHVALAWVLSPAAYDAALQVLSGKEKTLLQGGLIRVTTDVVDPDTTPGNGNGSMAPMALAQPCSPCVPANNAPSDAARSDAERFLFAQLEGWPETRGLFVLNRREPIAWGNQPFMEVDLLCPSLRIAMEIDGYYHFTDLNAYRRDRRKDVSLQCHDYFVLRYHADDIVEKIEEIRAAIAQAMVRQKQRRLRDSPEVS